MTKMDGIDKFLHPANSASGTGTGEAAPGVERYDVEAVSSKEKRSLYAERKGIYPRLADGTFRRLKWTVMAVTLGIYYLLPWIRWDRGPNLPDQAFLLDFANQRLFFGPLEVWAQEFYFIIGILIISALGLFLVTSIAGRMWCGYACPQTVWTDLMIAVERFWQGDRNARIRLDKEPWGVKKITLKTATHISWLLISLATGGALVFYFRDAPTLAQELLTGTAPGVAYSFVLIFTISTYLLGGIAREQVCIYMCPWPRIQGAMLDHDSLLIAYRPARGEPRGPHRKGQSWDNRGDCIDCKACVAVCPMGIDIRDGAQLECIQCALCIDACDEIMRKIGRPTELIAYSTIRNVTEPGHPRDGWRIVRPRTIIYASVVTLVSAIMLWGMANRTTLEVTVLPDRNPLFVQLSDGSIQNGFTVKILNKLHDVRRVKLEATGLPEAAIAITGFEGQTDPEIDVVPDNLRALRVHVKVPKTSLSKLTSTTVPFEVKIKTLDDGTETARSTFFRSPAP